jgi:hypothetical protein
VYDQAKQTSGSFQFKAQKQGQVKQQNIVHSFFFDKYILYSFFSFFAFPCIGDYTVCFSNAMSMVTGKLVSFKMYVGDELHEKNAATAGQ